MFQPIRMLKSGMGRGAGGGGGGVFELAYSLIRATSYVVSYRYM